MRINSIIQNTIKHIFKSAPKTTEIAKVVAPAVDCLEMHNIPSSAFNGILLKTSVEKLELPKSLKLEDGEIYTIKLLDRRKTPIDAFLLYSPPKDDLASGYHNFNIYDKQGNDIGSVGMNFSEWKGYKSISRAYTRLHALESKAHNISGIGSTLIQASVEKSLQAEAKGRIYVYAWNFDNNNNDPFVFYKKMGLSVVPPLNPPDIDYSAYAKNASFEFCLPMEKFIEQINKLKGCDYRDLAPDDRILSIYETFAHLKPCSLNEVHLEFSEQMYMHDNKVKEIWLPKIESNPIFNEQNRLK